MIKERRLEEKNFLLFPFKNTNLACLSFKAHLKYNWNEHLKITRPLVKVAIKKGKFSIMYFTLYPQK